MLIKWLSEKLGIPDILSRLNQLESKLEYLEEQTHGTLAKFGKYQKRTKGELDLMKNQIDGLIDSIENICNDIENKDKIENAKSLIRRLKNNKTRINKALLRIGA